MKPRHTIIIITYNQEKLIGRAIDSLLIQKEFVFEIVIADDCSTDKTWKVIQQYEKQYPEFIKPYQNYKNLGIFGNIESTWVKVNGDIIWYLAGDDVYCNGIFEEANKLIEKNNVDFKNNAVTLYFDYKAVDPSGHEIIYSNRLVEKYNPISLKIRQLISNRTIGFSKKVLDKFYPVRKDIGIHADGLVDIQVQLFSSSYYYSPFIGSIYYTEIGIASRTIRDSALKSNILALEQLKIDIKNLSRNDENWLNYLQKQISFKITPSLPDYIAGIKFFFLINQKYYGCRFLLREIICIMKNTIKLLIFKVK
jgi:glycosyltransferase involved in cell wall biosynthesis